MRLADDQLMRDGSRCKRQIETETEDPKDK